MEINETNINTLVTIIAIIIGIISKNLKEKLIKRLSRIIWLPVAILLLLAIFMIIKKWLLASIPILLIAVLLLVKTRKITITRKLQPAITIIFLITAFIFLTLFSWILLWDEGDRFFVNLLIEWFEKAEVREEPDPNILIVDVYRPHGTNEERLIFRENVGQFLQDLATATPEEPDLKMTVGLDIYFLTIEKDYEDDQLPEVTKTLIKGIEDLRGKDVDIITAYNPELDRNSYDKKIVFGKRSIFNDENIGHIRYINSQDRLPIISPFAEWLLNNRDNEEKLYNNEKKLKKGEMFYIKVLEDVRNDQSFHKEYGNYSVRSITRTKKLEAFPILVAKKAYDNNKNNRFIKDKDEYKDYDMLAVSYQSNFEIFKYGYPDNNVNDKICDLSENYDIVIVGNSKDIEGLAVMARTVQCLKSGEVSFIMSETWGFIFILLAFVELLAFHWIRKFTKFKMRVTFMLVFLGIFSLTPFIIWYVSFPKYIFKSFTIVLSGTLFAGLFYCLYLHLKKQEISADNKTYLISLRYYERYKECFERLRSVDIRLKESLRNHYRRKKESEWELELHEAIKEKPDPELSLINLCKEGYEKLEEKWKKELNSTLSEMEDNHKLLNSFLYKWYNNSDRLTAEAEKIVNRNKAELKYFLEYQRMSERYEWEKALENVETDNIEEFRKKWYNDDADKNLNELSNELNNIQTKEMLEEFINKRYQRSKEKLYDLIQKDFQQVKKLLLKDLFKKKREKQDNEWKEGLNEVVQNMKPDSEIFEDFLGNWYIEADEWRDEAYQLKNDPEELKDFLKNKKEQELEGIISKGGAALLGILKKIRDNTNLEWDVLTDSCFERLMKVTDCTIQRSDEFDLTDFLKHQYEYELMGQDEIPEFHRRIRVRNDQLINNWGDVEKEYKDGTPKRKIEFIQFMRDSFREQEDKEKFEEDLKKSLRSCYKKLAQLKWQDRLQKDLTDNGEKKLWISLENRTKGSSGEKLGLLHIAKLEEVTGIIPYIWQSDMTDTVESEDRHRLEQIINIRDSLLNQQEITEDEEKETIENCKIMAKKYSQK